MLDGFVQSQIRRVLPREPRVNLGLPYMTSRNGAPLRFASAADFAARSYRRRESSGISRTRKSSSIPVNRLSGMIQTPNRGPPEWTTSRPSAGIWSGKPGNSLPQQVLSSSQRAAASPSASTTTPRASSPVALNWLSMTSGFRISSRPWYASMHTGVLGGPGQTTPFSSMRYGITLLSVSPSTSSFLGWSLHFLEVNHLTSTFRSAAATMALLAILTASPRVRSIL